MAEVYSIGADIEEFGIAPYNRPMNNRQTTSRSLALPETFAFSQSSLQAYEDCPRRFWLAYVEQLPWPAVE
ncbi:MAG: PD-(D/E)XK nuclease family protein, partial [Anaerolineales bacterium]|nr:PD-(D/E)XK nuclease family protein [Anaerolineales bacterium]